MKKKIFVADNDFDYLYLLHNWLTDKGFYVRTFSCSKPLFDALDESLPDLILLNVNLQGEDGRHICKQIKNLYHEKVFVILSSENPVNLKSNRNDGAEDGIIHKTFNREQIYYQLNSYIRQANSFLIGC